MKRVVFALLVAAGLSAAAAQEFLFVSDRLPAEPEFSPAGNLMSQNDIFLYRDGSEIRLTFTPTEDEWDPQPSPSGQYVAYVVNTTLVDWESDVWPETWNWNLRIMDMESGLLLEEWVLPGAQGYSRVAGGFQIAWYPDEQSLLVQTLDADMGGRIALFEVGNPEARIFSRGFGVHLEPTRLWYATAMDGYVTVVDPFSGNQYALRLGEPLGWAGTDVVIGGAGALSIYDPVTARQTVLAESGEYFYTEFTISPDGSRYAWLRYSFDSGSDVTVIGSDLQDRWTWQAPDFVTELSWLDNDQLMLTGMYQDQLTISRLRPGDPESRILVGTHSSNSNAVPLP